MLKAQHLKMVQFLTLTEAYIQLNLLSSLVYSYSYQRSYFAKKNVEPHEETRYLWTRSEIRFRFT